VLFHFVQAGASITWLTPEGVFRFFRADPIDHLVVLFLLSHLLRDRRFIQSHRTHIVAPRPQVPVPILVFQVGMSIKDHQRTLPLQVPHEARHAHLWRDRHQQMDMILHRFPLDDFYPFPLAQISQYLHDTRFVFVVDDLATLLGREHDVILTHPFCMC